MRIVIISILLIGNILFLNSQSPYSFDLAKEGSITFISLGLSVGSYYIDQKTSIITAEEIVLLDADNINPLDRNVVNFYSEGYDLASDMALYINSALPLTLLLSRPTKNLWKDIAILYAETVALNGALTLITKSSSKRLRPYNYNPDVDLEKKLKSKSKKSFISGHSSQSAALAFLTAKIFNDVFPESSHKVAIWTSATIVPAITAFTRVRAGDHFTTDVIAGYLLGMGVGILIPEIHRKNRKFLKQVHFNVFPNTVALTWNIN